jgi:hypothetical protein
VARLQGLWDISIGCQCFYPTTPAEGPPDPPVLPSIAVFDVRRYPADTLGYDDETVSAPTTGWATSSARRGDRTHSTAATSATSTHPVPIRKASW